LDRRGGGSGSRDLGRRDHGQLALAVSAASSPRRALVDRGPYRFLRHPIYVGGFLFFAGLSLVFSVYALALTALLASFWVAKARLEERHLLARFPDYAAYRRRTLF
jgi:protein-S-isoprenylcysteine O-methyltransferase Ste14